MVVVTASVQGRQIERLLRAESGVEWRQRTESEKSWGLGVLGVLAASSPLSFLLLAFSFSSLVLSLLHFFDQKFFRKWKFWKLQAGSQVLSLLL